MTMTDMLLAYENDELDEGEVVDLFQMLIDSGYAWTLQGSYGRMAMRLINAGLCTPAQPEGRGTNNQR